MWINSLFGAIYQLVLVGAVEGGAHPPVAPQRLRVVVELGGVVKVRPGRHVLDVVHAHPVLRLLQGDGRGQRAHGTRYCLQHIQPGKQSVIELKHLLHHGELSRLSGARYNCIYYLDLIQTHKYSVPDVLLDVLYLLAALLLREAVHVQDAHLLHDGGLARLSSAQEEQPVGRPVQLEYTNNKLDDTNISIRPSTDSRQRIIYVDVKKWIS